MWVWTLIKKLFFWRSPRPKNTEKHVNRGITSRAADDGE